MLGYVLCSYGDLATARTHLEQGIALSSPQQYRSPGLLNTSPPGVFGLACLATVLWYLGYADQALQRSQEALTLAHRQARPSGVATALIFAAYLHYLRREVHITCEHAEAALVLAREQGFAERVAEATILRGWALVEQGQGEAGIAQMHQGLAAHRATGAQLSGLYLRPLVEASRHVGQGEEGLRVIAQRLAIRNRSGEGPWVAEWYRLKGVLLLTRSPEHQAEAEFCFRQAFEMQRCLGVKSLELQAAMSLSRLWQCQDKRQEAFDLLAPVYGWFTEGFDTADLQEAKALLEELGEE
jgi:predicted ATPase